MSHWKNYLKETKNIETVEDEYGIYAYEILKDSVFFHHVYLSPEFRETEKATDRMKEYYKLAKKHNKEVLTMAVDVTANNCNENVLRYIQGGAFIYDVKYPFIYLLLKIENIRI